MINIGFTGDFCPWLRVEESLEKEDNLIIDDEILAFFRKNDLNIIDLECPLTLFENVINKTGPHLKANPKTVSLLHKVNCKLVATSNNHFKDYGIGGMSDTYDVLRENKIDWVGSGSDTDTVVKPYLYHQQGTSIAVVNYSENEWSSANSDEGGCNGLDVVRAYNDIHYLSKNNDFVVVVMHGGHENYELPSPRMQELYRFFVDCGANAVVGHHTHVVSGVEIYKEAPIFYSLGNFCFDWPGKREENWNIGMILRLYFKKGNSVKFEYKFIEQMSADCQIKLLSGDKLKFQEERIEKLNTVISNKIALKEAFDAFIDSWYPIMDAWIQPYSGKLLPSLLKRKLMPRIFGNKKQKLLTNLVRCESHRDILLATLLRNITK